MHLKPKLKRVGNKVAHPTLALPTMEQRNTLWKFYFTNADNGKRLFNSTNRLF